MAHEVIGDDRRVTSCMCWISRSIKHKYYTVYLLFDMYLDDMTEYTLIRTDKPVVDITGTVWVH
jgi:hypothetical protein